MSSSRGEDFSLFE